VHPSTVLANINNIEDKESGSIPKQNTSITRATMFCHSLAATISYRRECAFYINLKNDFFAYNNSKKMAQVIVHKPYINTSDF
jgi:hypothetical protein